MSGAWLSLVERPVRDRKVAGSNPVAPTNFIRESCRACWSSTIAATPGRSDDPVVRDSSALLMPCLLIAILTLLALVT